MSATLHLASRNDAVYIGETNGFPAALMGGTFMHPILLKLKDGDRRSIGCADEVAEEISGDSSLLEVVFEGMLCDDPVIRMRAADAVEKATRAHPDRLRPFKALLLNEVSASEQQEVRWHVAQMVPRLELDEQEREQVVALLKDYLRDESRIVRTNAMQALADLAQQDESLRPQVIPILHEATATGSAAMRARGRKLLASLSPEDDGKRRWSPDAPRHWLQPEVRIVRPEVRIARHSGPDRAA